MKTRALKITTFLLSLGLVLFVGSVGYSLLPPRLGITPPSSFVWDYEPANATIYLETNMTITNNGLYSISDLVVGLTLTNSSGTNFLVSQTDPLTIPPSTISPIAVRLPINITEMLLTNNTYNVFHSDLINITLFFQAGYAYNIFRVTFGMVSQMAWSAPLENLTMQFIDTDIYLEEEVIIGSTVQVSHDGWLPLNNVPIALYALYNESVIGSGLGTIDVLPGVHASTVNLTFDPVYEPFLLTENASLTIGANILGTESPIAADTSLSWGAPLYNLTVSPLMIQPVNASYDELSSVISATNFSPGPFEANVTIQVLKLGVPLGENSSTWLLPAGGFSSFNVSIIVSALPAGSNTLVIQVQLTSPLDVLVLEETMIVNV